MAVEEHYSDGTVIIRRGIWAGDSIIGKAALASGWIEETRPDGTKVVTEVANGEIQQVQILTPEQAEILGPVKYIVKVNIHALDEKTPIRMNEAGEVVDGVLEGDGYQVTMKGGKLELFKDQLKMQFKAEDKEVLFSQYGLTEEDLQDIVMGIRLENGEISLGLTNEHIQEKTREFEKLIGVIDYIFSDYQKDPDVTVAEKAVDTLISAYQLSEDYDHLPWWRKMIIDYLVETYRSKNNEK